MIMKSRTVAIFALLAIALACVGLADTWNKKTILTINEPLKVPGAVLQPGKYVMKLMDSPSNRHIVQIWNADENHLITTILAIPNYRLEPKGKTEFGFWEAPKGAPVALRAWFYPGDNFGQEFAYRRPEVTRIETAAVMNNQHVPVLTEEMETQISKPVTTETETVTVTKPAETVVPPAPVAEQPAPTEQVAATTTELPQTASPLPVFALFGVLALTAGIGIRAVIRYAL
jgi:hypothetical protein